MSAVTKAGVVGAGTMGAGIAQALAQAGTPAVVFDADPDVAQRAIELVTKNLRKGAERGRWSEEEAAAALERVTTTGTIDELAGCSLVIEAVPERLDIKRDVLARLAEVCGEETVLATNTSSLLVSSIAATTPVPERVVGMHFFNPAPLMGLVEVVPGLRTSQPAVDLAVATVEAMGKRAIVAADGIGFVVNRCARPFYGEAFRLLAEGRAEVEQIDRICRLGGGFRMGPFELIDLIGVDVNFEIASSFFEQSFCEPRWQPSPIQGRLVAAGLHGRKSGRGFYDYTDGPPHSDLPTPPPAGGGEGRLVAIHGDGAIADGLRGLASDAGFSTDGGKAEPWLTIDAGLDPGSDLGSGPRVVSCASQSLARRGAPGAMGFSLLTPDSALVELTRNPQTDPEAAARADEFFASLGLLREEVGDCPGLVLGRIVAQIVNEAAFAWGEGVATQEDIDAGLMLGLNFPAGPFDWASRIGTPEVRAILDGLWDERHDPRYRAAPALVVGELS